MGGMNTALFVCSVPLPTQPTPSIDPRVRFTNLVNWWYCDGETRTLLFVFVLFLLTCRSLAWGRSEGAGGSKTPGASGTHNHYKLTIIILGA